MEFKLGETNVVCTDIANSEAFYVGVLGFERLAEEDGALHLFFDGRPFLLLPFAKAPAGGGYGERACLSFDLLVEDLKSAADYFKSKGVAFTQEYAEESPYFVVSDPDGNFIEVIQSEE